MTDEARERNANTYLYKYIESDIFPSLLIGAETNGSLVSLHSVLSCFRNRLAEGEWSFNEIRGENSRVIESHFPQFAYRQILTIS